MSELARADDLWRLSQSHLREASKRIEARKFDDALSSIQRAGLALTEAIETFEQAKEHKV